MDKQTPTAEILPSTSLTRFQVLVLEALPVTTTCNSMTAGPHPSDGHAVTLRLEIHESGFECLVCVTWREPEASAGPGVLELEAVDHGGEPTGDFETQRDQFPTLEGAAERLTSWFETALQVDDYFSQAPAPAAAPVPDDFGNVTVHEHGPTLVADLDLCALLRQTAVHLDPPDPSTLVRDPGFVKVLAHPHLAELMKAAEASARSVRGADPDVLAFEALDRTLSHAKRADSLAILATDAVFVACLSVPRDDDADPETVAQRERVFQEVLEALSDVPEDSAAIGYTDIEDLAWTAYVIKFLSVAAEG